MAEFGPTRIKVLIDTGSPVSLLSDKVWKAAGKPELRVWMEQNLIGINGSPLKVLGQMETDVSLSKVTCHTKFIIVENMSIEGILGIDFLTQNACNIDICNHRLYFSQERIYIPLLGLSCPKLVVRLVNTVQIPGRTEKEVLATTDMETVGKTWLLEQTSHRQSASVYIARALVKPHSRYFPIRILNYSDTLTTLHGNMTIGELYSTEQTQISAVTPASEVSFTKNNVDETRRKQLQNLVDTSSTHLSPSEKKEFCAFVMKYSDCFAFPTDTLGRTCRIEHSIDTGHNSPIRQRFRRMPPHQQQHVTELVDDMTKKDIIQPSNSPWASPIVLVKKKMAVRDSVSITVKLML